LTVNQGLGEMMSIKIKKRTPAEIEADVDRYSQLGKEFSAVGEGKDSADVFFASLLFFSNCYAMNFGEERRARMSSMIHGQLHLDMLESIQDQARSHFKQCQDCRPDMPCQNYFKLVERIADAVDARTLRVHADGSFELSDQPCPNES
jgi:hypothetical protein